MRAKDSGNDMAEEKQEQLSPEEKLLKVIQNGGQAPAKETPEEKVLSAVRQPAVAAAPAIAASKPAAAKVPEPAARAREPAPAKAPEPVARAAEPAARALAAPAPTPVAVPPRKIPVVARPAPAEPVAAQPAGEAPKLKLTKVPAHDHDKERAAKAAAFAKAMSIPAAAPVVAEATPDASVKPAAVPAGKATVPAGQRKKNREPGGVLAIANRAIAAVALLVLCFSAYEIWASVRWESLLGSGQGQVRQGDGGSVDVYPDPYALDIVMDNYRKRSLFGNTVQPVVLTSNDVRQVAVGPLDEALKNLKLIGHSRLSGGGSEGIVVDKENKMQFLKVGDKFPFNNSELSVIEVLPDRVIVKTGEQTGVIK